MKLLALANGEIIAAENYHTVEREEVRLRITALRAEADELEALLPTSNGAELDVTPEPTTAPTDNSQPSSNPEPATADDGGTPVAPNANPVPEVAPAPAAPVDPNGGISAEQAATNAGVNAAAMGSSAVDSIHLQ